MTDEAYKKLLQELPESNFSPSIDFTANVMDRIQEAAENKEAVKPLIPAYVFRILALLFIGIALLPLFIELQSSVPSYFEDLNFGFINSDTLRESLQISLHLIFAFGTVVLADAFMKQFYALLGFQQTGA